MNLRKFFFRDEQECSVEETEFWLVKWQAYCEYDSIPGVFASTKRKAFLSRLDAKRFAKALRDASKLLGNNRAKVSVKKGR